MGRNKKAFRLGKAFLNYFIIKKNYLSFLDALPCKQIEYFKDFSPDFTKKNLYRLKNQHEFQERIFP